MALLQHLCCDVIRLQSGHFERLARKPIFHHAPLICVRAHVAINRLEYVEHVHLRVELSEATRREKQVIEVARPGAGAPYDKDRGLHAYQQIPS